MLFRSYSARYFLGQQGNMNCIDSVKIDKKSLGHYYISLTEFLGFRRHKDEGKIVGMSGHGEFVSDLYDAWKDIIKIEDLQTDTCDHFDIPGGSIYRDMHNNFFSLYGSMYYKNPLFLNRIVYTGQYIFEEKILFLIKTLNQFSILAFACSSFKAETSLYPVTSPSTSNSSCKCSL